MRAIIVEDEILTALHLESVLEELGVESIGIAPDMPAALELAEHRPDLALVDLNLRDGFTGPRVASELSSRGISVLFVTANPAQLEGVDDVTPAAVLEKPLETDRLGQVIAWLRAEGRTSGSPTTQH
jgi:CheY-like chemotaxis protein